MRLFFILFAAIALAPSALGQTSAFLEIDNIEGESQVPSYEDQIELTSWSQGVANLGDGPVVLPFRFTHKIDSASPPLALAAILGTNLQTVKLRALRIGGGKVPIEYWQLDLDDTRVVSVKTGIEVNAGTFAAGNVEEVTLDCSTFTLSYIPQTNTGAPGTPITVSGSCTR